MVHGGAEYSTDNAKCSIEVPSIPRRASSGPRRFYIFQGECEMFHGDTKYSRHSVKFSTEVLNIPRKMSNVPRRC